MIKVSHLHRDLLFRCIAIVHEKDFIRHVTESIAFLTYYGCVGAVSTYQRPKSFILIAQIKFHRQLLMFILIFKIRIKEFAAMWRTYSGCRFREVLFHFFFQFFMTFLMMGRCGTSAA